MSEDIIGLLLTEKEVKRLQSKEKSTSLNKEQLAEVIFLINIAQEIAGHYKSLDAFEESIRGMRYGLSRYKERYEDFHKKDFRLSVFLTWYMKTAIEVSEGIDNEDTRRFSQIHDSKNLKH